MASLCSLAMCLRTISEYRKRSPQMRQCHWSRAKMYGRHSGFFGSSFGGGIFKSYATHRARLRDQPRDWASVAVAQKADHALATLPAAGNHVGHARTRGGNVVVTNSRDGWVSLPTRPVRRSSLAIWSIRRGQGRSWFSSMDSRGNGEHRWTVSEYQNPDFGRSLKATVNLGHNSVTGTCHFEQDAMQSSNVLTRLKCGGERVM
jgi:hypothetical protein